MSTTVLERTVKRRRGYYRMTDIHASRLTYNDGSPYYTDFVAYYTLDQYERVSISATKKFVAYSTRACQIINGREVDISRNFTQETTVQFVPDPTIFISNDLGVIGNACSINYRISDSDSSVRFKIIEKINGVKIAEKNNVVDGNYELIITDELLSELAFNSVNNITIELDNGYGGIFLDKTVTFTKGNTKPKLNITSYNSTSATFTAIDTDNNLSKIEWFIDDVLKETITTDLTTEKTINYELADNAIHTLKIVATDAENATVEKVLSINKEIMPLQEDASLSDISTKLIEIGEGFKNGKTSIINTLALKNIEASLNNTLVELSEKIKASFDSSDASVQDLMNQLTQANNTISQLNSKYKYATGTAYARENSSLIACVYDPNTSHTVTETSPYWLDLNGIGFIPDIFFAECEYEPHSNAFYKYFVFAIKNTFPISNNTGFVVNIAFNKGYGDESFKLRGALYTLGKRHVSMDNNGVRVPSLSTLNDFRAYKWHAIKFK
ncbi:TPA: hypothetical protein SOL37_004167 [Clostridioides difficile]|uniref:hypothetical protein n=2 Tax=Clostridioides difficile TaxID=1496 RepID=UPI00097FE6AF|nr:hypothetical protein [Clostridioides difficile]EGT3663669.1 hypothetical protein [Clostridioides difficile]EGT5490753.1 hypothetical protein [Clostridioides difficile]MDL5148399.1 hypothetical protein [Clostridioides difficile]SJT22411.1 Uncharacterised protein [Clostridioides difficile]HBF0261507.1 hypothetical protein [Clostridioides difficile]